MIHSVCLSPCLTKNNFVHLFYFSTRFFPCRCAFFFTKKCREARWYDLTFLSWLWFDIPKNIICREEQHHIFLIVRWACSHSSIQPPTTTNKWLYKRNGAVYMYKCSSSHPSIKHNNKFMKMFTWSDVPWFGVQLLDVVGMYPPRAHVYNNNDNSIKTKLLEW